MGWGFGVDAEGGDCRSECGARPKRATVSSVSGDMSRSIYHASSRSAIAYGDPFDSASLRSG